MRIGIPTESRAGERLVAATPKTVAPAGRPRLRRRRRARGRATPRRSAAEAYEAAGATRRGRRTTSGPSDVVAKVNAPTDDEVAALRPGATLVAMLAPASAPALVERPARAGRDRARARRRAAHLPRAGARRAQHDVQRRRLPRGGRGRRGVRRHVHRPGHRGGQDAAGAGVRHRRGRGRARGDRRGRQHGRPRPRVRRAARGRRADRVDGRDVRAGGGRPAGGQRRRVRQRADRRAGAADRSRCTPPRRPTRTSSSPPRWCAGTRRRRSPRRWSPGCGPAA